MLPNPPPNPTSKILVNIFSRISWKKRIFKINQPLTMGANDADRIHFLLVRVRIIYNGSTVIHFPRVIGGYGSFPVISSFFLVFVLVKIFKAVEDFEVRRVLQHVTPG